EVPVPWAGRLGDRRGRDQAQIPLRRHAPGAHHVAPHPVTPAPAVAEVAAPAAPSAPTAGGASVGMSHAEHVGLHFSVDASLDISKIDVAQDISVSTKILAITIR